MIDLEPHAIPERYVQIDRLEIHFTSDGLLGLGDDLSSITVNVKGLDENKYGGERNKNKGNKYYENYFYDFHEWETQINQRGLTGVDIEYLII